MGRTRQTADLVSEQNLIVDITNDRVGVGTDGPASRLDVYGAISVNGIEVIDSSRNITGVNVNSTSDERLKDNIKSIDNPLEKVLSLRGVEYDRNDIEGNPHQIGVIAQEVEKIIPELVSESNDGIKSVSYGNITALLIEAIKELKSEIDILKEQR